MRTFRILAALMMAVVCVGLSSCSKDDEEKAPEINQANLIGKWQSTWEKVIELKDGKEVVTFDEANTLRFWEFKADGTCKQDEDTNVYKWSLKDNELTIIDDVRDFTDIYIVKELAASKLVLAFEDWDNTDDGGTELDDRTIFTYKKIN